MNYHVIFFTSGLLNFKTFKDYASMEFFINSGEWFKNEEDEIIYIIEGGEVSDFFVSRKTVLTLEKT